MHSLAYSWLMVWAVATGLVPGKAAQGSPARTVTRSSLPTVAVKEAEPVWLVFIEHVGPYWTVGPLFARVRTYMLEHGQSGPIFLRYPKDPWRASAGSLRARIGFLTTEDYTPEPPFKIARRDRERVAEMVVKDRSSLRRQDYAYIHQWIQANGYETTGPVTEIYDIAPPGRTLTRPHTQLQVSLVSPVRESIRQASGDDAIDDATIANEPVTLTEESADSGTVESAKVATYEPAASTTPDQESVAQTDARVHQPVEPICELMAAGRFDRIAEQLMPDDREIPAALQLWLGQVVFRIGAAAKGIERLDPDGEAVAGRMADAITDRYKEVSVNFELDPLAQAVVRIDVRNDPLGLEKRAVMRELDLLLGRIAFHGVGAVDAGTVADELAGIVQRAQYLMTRRSSGQSESGGL